MEPRTLATAMQAIENYNALLRRQHYIGELWECPSLEEAPVYGAVNVMESEIHTVFEDAGLVVCTSRPETYQGDKATRFMVSSDVEHATFEEWEAELVVAWIEMEEPREPEDELDFRVYRMHGNRKLYSGNAGWVRRPDRARPVTGAEALEQLARGYEAEWARGVLEGCPITAAGITQWREEGVYTDPCQDPGVSLRHDPDDGWSERDSPCGW